MLGGLSQCDQNQSGKCQVGRSESISPPNRSIPRPAQSSGGAAQATVAGFYTKLADADLLELLDDETITKVGIDAPFGWPLQFVEALGIYAEKGEWPTTEARLLTLRATDRWVRDVTGRDPLSVSTDKISVTAMRCARLLTEYGRRWEPVDRSGAGSIAEVYPAAALRQWGLEPRGYKGSKPEQVARRRKLIEEFATATQGWLLLTDSDVAQCAQSDHLLDALIAAIVARVAEHGHSLPIPRESLEHARREGWIALPTRGALSTLDLTSDSAVPGGPRPHSSSPNSRSQHSEQ